MPPLLSLIIATVFFIIYRTVMGDFAFGFLAGFLMGYAAYLAVHYSIHHYREPDRAFGVTSPFWDHVFRTMPRKIVEREIGTSIDD